MRGLARVILQLNQWRSSMVRSQLVALALAVTVLFFGTRAARAQERTEVGALTCKIGPSIGALIASRRRMDCRYNPTLAGRVERYSGMITRFGLDVRVTAGGVMTWRGFRANTSLWVGITCWSLCWSERRRVVGSGDRGQSSHRGITTNYRAAAIVVGWKSWRKPCAGRG
jgi:Protein of unknown function (DUF992)